MTAVLWACGTSEGNGDSDGGSAGSAVGGSGGGGAGGGGSGGGGAGGEGGGGEGGGGDGGSGGEGGTPVYPENCHLAYATVEESCTGLIDGCECEFTCDGLAGEKNASNCTMNPEQIDCTCLRDGKEVGEVVVAMSGESCSVCDQDCMAPSFPLCAVEGR